MPKMTKKAAKALEGSIKKWEGILNGTVRDGGIGNCPLCNEFYDNEDCFGCPVSQFTKKSCCDGSPYGKFNELERKEKAYFIGSSQLTKKGQKAAQAELDFLIALRDKS